jgi:hypothetical protein
MDHLDFHKRIALYYLCICLMDIQEAWFAVRPEHVRRVIALQPMRLRHTKRLRWKCRANIAIRFAAKRVPNYVGSVRGTTCHHGDKGAQYFSS